MSTTGEYEYRIFLTPPKDPDQPPDELLYLGEDYGKRILHETAFKYAVRVEITWVGLDGDEEEPIALHTRESVSDKWTSEEF